jgi:integrase/recombinase XerD
MDEVLDPKSLVALSRKYLAWLEASNAGTAYTLKTRKHQLGAFVSWCADLDIIRAQDVTRAHIESYQRAIFHRRKKNGDALAYSTQASLLVAVCVWFRWLAKHNEIVYNPATDLELPRRDRNLPRRGFSLEEVEEVLSRIDTTTLIGIRDRALFEVLYSTGLRRFELCGLKLYDVDRAKRTVFVRQGKGRKDRVVPIGNRALAWLEKYLEHVRPTFSPNDDEDHLFLTQKRTAVSPNALTRLGLKVIQDAGQSRKWAACHVFRHTAATLMLEGGADVRVLQEFLGHSHLDSTQVYTHVTIQHLKEVHERTHPARLEPENDGDGDAVTETTDGSEEEDEEK